MKEIVDKLMEIEKETSAEKGEYNLFALSLREDSVDKWDILVSAKWIDNDKGKALRYLAPKIQKAFTEADLLQISKIVIIEDTNPVLPAFQKAVNIEHGSAEIRDLNFYGVPIRHAILITSRSPQTA